ncbi:uncharacterized protein [Typha angustifolia]|uniref:uncharacterized protein n=1 Tax=Typha angustifolia TaxID=59011 RepID=UPI003C303AA6
MEGNIPTGSMIPGASYGALDLQGSMHMHLPHPSHPHFHQPQQQVSHSQHHQGSMVHPPMHDTFPLSMNHMHECDQHPPVPFVDYNKGERGKNYMSEEDEPSLTEDGIDSHNEKGNKGFPWQRMKWTDGMVRLLITAVSYIGEDVASDCNSGGRRKHAILQKKGKWKSISKVMAKRGCYVSPQQCEDKFNDLNKRYKRLTDILGRGTSCKVVENPALMDHMEHLSDKLKDDVRKILSSKHLFYEEMCSYHNGNRLNLPADPALQRSLQLALRSRDEHDPRRGLNEDTNEDDQSADSDDEEDNAEEHHVLHGDRAGSCFPKRLKCGGDHEDAGFGQSTCLQDYTGRSHTQGINVDMNQAFPEGSNTMLRQKQLVSSHLLQLEERHLQIEVQIMELEKRRFKWLRFSKKKDRELQKMRMENESIKLGNERLALEVKYKELEVDLKVKKTNDG